jgi:hypothetical protein
VINPEMIKLPVWVIGVGLIHAAGLALVLPMLITLPGPGRIERKTEAVDVVLVPAASAPAKVDPEMDQTAALPPSPQSEPGAGEEGPTEPEDKAPEALANLNPDAAPSTPTIEQAVPKSETPAPSNASAKKPKMEGKAKAAKPAKAQRAAPKKPAVARAKPAKPLFRRVTAKDLAKGPAPFKGSWSQLLGGPPPTPSVKR